MRFKNFLSPDWRKLIVYLFFIIIFMFETLLLLSINQERYIATFLSNVYNKFFGGEEAFIDVFALAFIYYIILLSVLYLLSCLVVFIIDKIRK